MRPDPKMVEVGPYTRKPRHTTMNGVGERELTVRRRPQADGRPTPWSHAAQLSIHDRGVHVGGDEALSSTL